MNPSKKKREKEKHDWHFGWPVTSAYFDSDWSCSWPLLDADSAVSHLPKVSSRMHHFPGQFGSLLSSTKTFWMYYSSFLCIYKKKKKKKKSFSKWTESSFGNSLHFDELVFPVTAVLERGLQSLCVFNMHVFSLRVQLSMHGCVCFQTSLLFSPRWTLRQYLWTWMTVFKLNTDLCN